jgi:hypothetical protein
VDVLLLLVVIAILVGVFYVAIGRGGELAYEQADHAPLDLGPVSATDVALLRPPTALWGYNMQVTDEALDAIARTLRDRDIEIAYLQRQLADLGHTPAVPETDRAPGRHASTWSSEDPWSRLWSNDPTAADPKTTDAAIVDPMTAVVEPTAVDQTTVDPITADPISDDLISDDLATDTMVGETVIETTAADDTAGTTATENTAAKDTTYEDTTYEDTTYDATHYEDEPAADGPGTEERGPDAEEQGW